MHAISCRRVAQKKVEQYQCDKFNRVFSSGQRTFTVFSANSHQCSGVCNCHFVDEDTEAQSGHVT